MSEPLLFLSPMRQKIVNLIQATDLQIHVEELEKATEWLRDVYLWPVGVWDGMENVKALSLLTSYEAIMDDVNVQMMYVRVWLAGRPVAFGSVAAGSSCSD